VLALVAASGGCGSDENEVVGGKGFEVSVPDDWDDATDRAEEVAFAGFAPEILFVGDREEGFQPSINVVRESSLAPDLSLSRYVEAAQEVLEQGTVGGEEIPGEDPEIEKPSRTTLAGEPALSFDQERSIEGKRLRLRQVIALRGRAAYSVTYTALEDRFDDDLGRFRSTLESWRWQ
jgi:hypothetical protein